MSSELTAGENGAPISATAAKRVRIDPQRIGRVLYESFNARCRMGGLPWDQLADPVRRIWAEIAVDVARET